MTFSALLLYAFAAHWSECGEATAPFAVGWFLSHGSLSRWPLGYSASSLKGRWKEEGTGKVLLVSLPSFPRLKQIRKQVKLVCTEPNLSFSLQNGNITPHTEKGWARRNRIGETEPTDIRKKRQETQKCDGVLWGCSGCLGSSEK